MESSAGRRRASDAEPSAQSCSRPVKCEPAEAKEPECGVSDAAAAEGLYAGHEIKDEVVLGPELVQQQDIAFATPNALYIKEVLHEPKPASNHGAPGNTPTCPGGGHTNLSIMSTRQKLYNCRYCNKQFITKAYLNKHKQTHKDEKPFICDVCNKTFRYKSMLNSHVPTHTIEKPYSCRICDKRFTRKHALTQHTLTHIDKKPYSCSVCDKQFTFKTLLTNHMHIHIGQKPYGCDMCDKRFTTKSAVTIHTFIHTGEKRYSCGVCNKRFTQKISLTRHKQVHTD